MPDIVVTEWTLRALGLSPRKVKPHHTPHNHVLNISKTHLRSLQEKQTAGEPIEHTFFRSVAQPTHVARHLLVVQ